MKRILATLVVPILTFACAWRFGWDFRDLVWGFWVVSVFSTLGVVITETVVPQKAPTRVDPKETNPRVAALVIGAMSGFFYFGYALGLNDFFPRFEFAPDLSWHPFVNLARIIAHLWLVAAAAFFTVVAQRFFDVERESKLVGAVIQLLRFHVTMFLVLGLGALHAPTFLFYIAFVIAFFPYKFIDNALDKPKSTQGIQ